MWFSGKGLHKVTTIKAYIIFFIHPMTEASRQKGNKGT